jgi:acyl carrier protein
MTIEDITKLLKKCHINPKCEVTEDKTLGEIGANSLDVMMLSYEISLNVGHELKFQPNETIKDILAKANEG